MPTFMLRGIDSKLWARVCARAASQRVPLRALFLQLLALYASGALDHQITPPQEGESE